MCLRKLPSLESAVLSERAAFFPKVLCFENAVPKCAALLSKMLRASLLFSLTGSAVILNRAVVRRVRFFRERCALDFFSLYKNVVLSNTAALSKMLLRIRIRSLEKCRAFQTVLCYQTCFAVIKTALLSRSDVPSIIT